MTSIIILVSLGILLLLLEFFVIPGVTIAGIGGMLMIIGGVYIAYDSHGITYGNYTLLITSISIIIVLFFALRSKTWKKLALNTNIDSKVNAIKIDKIKIGDIGKTVSKLSPIGKVEINNEYFEAESISGYLDPNEEIEVKKILSNKIIVKSLKS